MSTAREPASGSIQLMNNVLGLFAKWPAPGAVKTRLAADTSPEFAARIAGAFLRDSLSRLASITARRILVGTPSAERVNFGAISTPHWGYGDQGEGDLGQRLKHFFSTNFEEGANRVVVVGSDSPTVPVDFISQSFEMLNAHDVVIGPAMDGGYYLIGGTPAMPEIFSGISWGTHAVLRETLDRLGHAKLAILPPWYDVDTLADCRFLAAHIEAMAKSGHDPHLFATIAALAALPT